MAFLPLAPVGTRTWTRSPAAAPLPPVSRPCRRPPPIPQWVAHFVALVIIYRRLGNLV